MFPISVIPAQAGIQFFVILSTLLDAGFHRHDGIPQRDKHALNKGDRQEISTFAGEHINSLPPTPLRA
jgi:hypothetical protein